MPTNVKEKGSVCLHIAYLVTMRKWSISIKSQNNITPGLVLGNRNIIHSWCFSSNISSSKKLSLHLAVNNLNIGYFLSKNVPIIETTDILLHIKD